MNQYIIDPVTGEISIRKGNKLAYSIENTFYNQFGLGKYYLSPFNISHSFYQSQGAQLEGDCSLEMNRKDLYNLVFLNSHFFHTENF